MSSPHNLSPLVLKSSQPHIAAIRYSLERLRCVLSALVVFDEDGVCLSADEDGF